LTVLLTKKSKEKRLPSIGSDGKGTRLKMTHGWSTQIKILIGKTTNRWLLIGNGIRHYSTVWQRLGFGRRNEEPDLADGGRV
jgi:hypothetical protein